MSRKLELDTMFYPRSVAVVGVSANSKRGGSNFATRLHKNGFAGNIYPVNPRATEIQGLKAYPDLKSIPETVDLVIVSVPGPRVPEVLEDCISTGVKNVHIFSSGFKETGEEEGRLLEEKITGIIRRGGLRVVGPNCMGIYVPASKLVPWGPDPGEKGPVAFLSQSGGHSEVLINYIQEMGMGVSKVISFGNAAGLQLVDFLEYLAEDPETKIITMYLEGMKDGNRVARLVKTINRTKPVIIWKGGLTDSGARAVASHTGSLAGAERVWKAFFAQTGAVSVNSIEEIADVVMAFMYLNPPRGRRTLLLGGGGGNSVEVCDICSREGLEVPALSEETRRKLAEFIPLAGNIIRNPLDIWQGQYDAQLMSRALETAIGDPAIDQVIFERIIGGWGDPNPEREEEKRKVTSLIIDVAKNNPYRKPLAVTFRPLGQDLRTINEGAKERKEFVTAGVPAYMYQTSAVRALSRFIKYHEFQSAREGSAGGLFIKEQLMGRTGLLANN